MKYTVNGKTVNIPNEEIENSMKALELSKEEAIQLWLEDNGFEENEEQNVLDEMAKKVKVNHGAGDSGKGKNAKPRTVVVSDEKKELFSEIFSNLVDVYKENAQIEKENKLITVKIADRTFKIDIIEQRKPKK
jgi:hypothetical protein